MEMVLGLSRSEIDIEEIRKRICYILLAVLLIISLAFTAESFENVVAVDTKDSWSVRERADVLPDVAGNSRLRDVKALAAEVFNQFILRFDLMLGNNLNYLLQTVLFHVVLIPFGVYFHLFVLILCCFAGQRPLREAPIRRADGFRRLPL